MAEKELIVRMQLLLDTIDRDFAECQRRGLIDSETHQVAHDSVSIATIALAGIQKR